MKRSLLMASAIVSFVLPATAPVVVLAQDRPEQAEGGSRPGRGERGSRQIERGDVSVTPRQRQAEPRAPSRQSDGARAEARGDRPQRPARPSVDRPSDDRPDRPRRPGGGDTVRPERPQRPDRPEGPRPQRPDGGRPERPDWNRPDRPQRPDGARPDRPSRPDRPGAGRPDTPGRPDRPGGWNRERDRDYRDFHNRWNRDQWRRDWQRRHDADWWRNDRRFRGWSGVRVGFYFAPGYGYYSVPRTYWNRQYYVGQYLPDVFWRYQVNDWRTYGLGYPPPGARWVYVDNAIYLIDERDGYIIEVVRDAWSW